MNQKLKYSVIKVFMAPFLFGLVMWIVKLTENTCKFPFNDYGVLPRKISGLKGILLSPFIHGDIEHLINNTLPIIMLGGALCFFYKKNYKEIFLWLFLTSGILLWGIGRPVFHIGASGVIYALASFIFFSGLISNNKRLSAMSLIVIFIYGSLFWGLLPVNPGVSWEGHLSGFIAGIIIAWFFRKEGPKRKKYQWEIDEELEAIEKKRIKIIYEYKEK
jgi:membrane associated rhomboid family serine protease|tara:strand:- start:608 stop:1261 length:654 start_codon:yes stop_codon:yes gene_type:complete